MEISSFVGPKVLDCILMNKEKLPRLPERELPQLPFVSCFADMVKTWLVNSMVENISCNYMCYSTTKKLRDSVPQMHSDLGN